MISSHLARLFELLADANKSGEYVNNAAVRNAFINNHVFDHWNAGTHIHLPPRKIPDRSGDQWIMEVGTIGLEPVFIKPSINTDTNYPSFMYVDSAHKRGVSKNVKLLDHFANMDEAKLLAMDKWDEAEISRVSPYNIKVAVYYARKRLTYRWLRHHGNHDQANKFKVQEDFDKFFQLITCKEFVTAALRFANLAETRLPATRFHKLVTVSYSPATDGTYLLFVF